jgi:hypothetical protein
MNQRLLKKTILEMLEGSDPYALPEDRLFSELPGRLGEPVTQADFEETLAWLSVYKHIRPQVDPLGDEITRWFITGTGKTLLGQSL